MKQPPGRFALDVVLKIKEEIERLLKAKFIKTTKYINWISNTMLVMKKNANWKRVLILEIWIIQLQKDEYPMPIADILIDLATGHEWMGTLAITKFT